MDDPIHERGKAIEDLFFAARDQQLLARLREEMASEESREALAGASGVSDPAVLDALLAIEVSPETLTSIGLIPLVAVAWADSVMAEAEKNAILQAADIAGIKIGTASHALLETWLTTAPKPELLAGWKSYIHSLKCTLEPEALFQLKTFILDRAENVAQSAGSFLGLGSKISDSERDVLDELVQAFD
jgi:hypothetical protein